jgi:NAD(P)-dependent dehydrogenase (short-subunit alcohol dehydrogenase family)
VDTAPAVSHPVSGDVLDRFPDLTVCVAQGNGYAVLRRPDTVGPDRVLWGSGYPFATDASRPRDIVESLSPAESEAVSGGAARTLLRLNGPAPWDDPGKESTVQEQETVSGGREVALVTGANKGIGFHVARQLGQAGRRVWLGSRSRERGEKAADQLRTEGVDVDLVLLDVTDDASVAAAQELGAREAGRLDILVNNAGVVAGDAAPSESQVDDVRRTYETNVFGVIAVTNAFLPLLRRSPRGRVVNVSSELGSIGGMADPEWEWAFLHLLAYQSSKAAQNAVTLLYAKELRDACITVNAVNPGIRATDMNTGDQSSLGDPADGAAIITKIALAGPDGPTGQFYEEDGSLYPW